MQRNWIILAIVAAVAVMWMARYDIVSVGTDAVYRLDRITGTVDKCSSFWGGCVPLNKRI